MTGARRDKLITFFFFTLAVTLMPFIASLAELDGRPLWSHMTRCAGHGQFFLPAVALVAAGLADAAFSSHAKPLGKHLMIGLCALFIFIALPFHFKASPASAFVSIHDVVAVARVEATTAFSLYGFFPTAVALRLATILVATPK